MIGSLVARLRYNPVGLAFVNAKVCYHQNLIHEVNTNLSTQWLCILLNCPRKDLFILSISKQRFDNLSFNVSNVLVSTCRAL